MVVVGGIWWSWVGGRLDGVGGVMNLSGMEEREKRKRLVGVGGWLGVGVLDIDGWLGLVWG